MTVKTLTYLKLLNELCNCGYSRAHYSLLTLQREKACILMTVLMAFEYYKLINYALYVPRYK